MTPGEFHSRMDMLVKRLLPDLGQQLGSVVFSRWAAGQVGHMRDAKNDIGARSSLRTRKIINPRRPGDNGPLRIVTGDYSKQTRAGGIRDIKSDGLRLIFKKGYDPKLIPQAYNETGATNENAFGRGIKTTIPARPTLEPGLKDALPGMSRIVQMRFQQAVRRAVA